MGRAKLAGLVAAGMLGAACSADVWISTPAGRLGQLNLDTGVITYVQGSRGHRYLGFAWRNGELMGLRYGPISTPGYCDLATIDTVTGMPVHVEPTPILVQQAEGALYYSMSMTGLPGGTLVAQEYHSIAPLDLTRVSVMGASGRFEQVGSLGVPSDGAMGADALGRVWTTSGVLGSSFMEVDPATGVARVVATIPDSIENIYAMVFDRGVLYGIGDQDSVYEINRGTGEFRFLRRVLGLPGFDYVNSVASGHPLCLGDLNSDGFVDFFDYSDFVTAFEAGTLRADVNADGFIDFFDYSTYVEAFEAGCEG